jgi:predicted MFS family arabinose efflux permease
MRFIVWGTLPIGALLGGVIGQTFGLYPALVVGGVGGAFSFLWLLLSQVRHVESIPTRPEVGIG